MLVNKILMVRPTTTAVIAGDRRAGSRGETSTARRKSKVKSQKAYKMGFSWILNGLFVYADLY